MSDTLSVKWLKKAQANVNEDPGFRKLGSVDTVMGLHVGKACFLVNFSGFTCHGVSRIPAGDLRDADFVVEMTPSAWHSFVAGRRAGDGPDLAELDTIEGVVNARDPRKKLDFLRYHLSVQAFLDAGAAAA